MKRIAVASLRVATDAVIEPVSTEIRQVLFALRAPGRMARMLTDRQWTALDPLIDLCRLLENVAPEDCSGGLTLPRDKTRICIEIDGKLREIFSVVEDERGQLILRIRSAQLCGYGSDTVETISHKVSVHLPQKSKTHSIIHMTQTLKDGTKIHRYKVTKAIMNDNGFTHVYFRQCSNLVGEHYSTKPADGPAEKQEIIGKFNSQFETIVHSVAVGSSQSTFEPCEFPNLTTHSFRFRKFTLVVLLTAVGVLPSHLEGSFIYDYTIAPEDFADHPRSKAMAEELMEGVSPRKCCEEFWFAANLLLGGFVKRRIEQDSAQMSPQWLTHLIGAHKVFATEVRKYVPKVREGFVQLHVDTRDWSFSGEEPDEKPNKASSRTDTRYL